MKYENYYPWDDEDEQVFESLDQLIEKGFNPASPEEITNPEYIAIVKDDLASLLESEKDNINFQILLAKEFGHSVSAIAETLSLKPAAVTKRIWRERQRLRKIYPDLAESYYSNRSATKSKSGPTPKFVLYGPNLIWLYDIVIEYLPVTGKDGRSFARPWKRIPGKEKWEEIKKLWHWSGLVYTKVIQSLSENGYAGQSYCVVQAGRRDHQKTIDTGVIPEPISNETEGNTEALPEAA